jgi:hypothetical protein
VTYAPGQRRYRSGRQVDGKLVTEEEWLGVLDELGIERHILAFRVDGRRGDTLYTEIPEEDQVPFVPE